MSNNKNYVLPWKYGIILPILEQGCAFVNISLKMAIHKNIYGFQTNLRKSSASYIFFIIDLYHFQNSTKKAETYKLGR